MSTKRLSPMVLVSLALAALALVPACAQKKPTAVAEKAD